MDLTDLEKFFTEEEVWAAIKSLPFTVLKASPRRPWSNALDRLTALKTMLPFDKAPGPDGFIGRFFNTAWHIIKVDLLPLSAGLCREMVIVPSQFSLHYFVT
jgi:hypothetical protein